MRFLKDLDDCGSIPEEESAYISSGMYQKYSWVVPGGLSGTWKSCREIKSVQ